MKPHHGRWRVVIVDVSLQWRGRNQVASRPGVQSARVLGVSRVLR